MYDQGKGVLQDYKTAVKWYTLAAEQGYASAQTNLGVSYSVGEGVPQDYVYSHMWGNISSSNGNENGGKLRDHVAEQMTPSQIEKAQKLARECVAKNYKGC
jgi:TPR repeat protein